MNRTIEYRRLGLVGYLEAFDLQRALVKERLAGEIGDNLLLLEHPPVITKGKRDCSSDFLSDPERIQSDGIDIVQVDRGGGLTYHGPGQLIGYFICDVSSWGGVKSFVRLIEELIILTVRDFGIDGARDPQHPGVWIGESKVAAIGLHIERSISSHGFALNVNCDMKAYRHIVACGLADRKVTNMTALMERPVDVDDVTKRFITNAEKVLGRSLIGRNS